MQAIQPGIPGRLQLSSGLRPPVIQNCKAWGGGPEIHCASKSKTFLGFEDPLFLEGSELGIIPPASASPPQHFEM